MIERRTIRFDHELLSEIELPCFEAAGASDGPHLCLLGGIHGGEYSSIAAVVRFMQALDTSGLSGRITAVPIVSMSSFRARTAFVVPEDGKNLNRCFPGSRDGTFADALAWHVFRELIEPSDALIDLHGGDMVEALEPFAIYDESPVEDRARALAIAFGLPYVVRSRDRRRSRQRDDELRCRCGGHSGRDRGGGRLRPARRGRGAAARPRACERAPPPGACCPASPRLRAPACGVSAASSGCMPAGPAGGSRTSARATSAPQARASARCETSSATSSSASRPPRTASYCS
jgi:hypothetical protein